MSVKNAMNCVDKEGTLFAVFNGVGYYGNNSKLVITEVPENVKNGMYNKKLFSELGEFELERELEPGYTSYINHVEFIRDEFVKWDIEKNKLNFLLSTVSEDETRFLMNGIYFDCENIVSTDGRRLIYTENQNINRNCIASCFRCKKLWAQAKEIYIGLKCSKLVFSDCTFYIEHIDGQFPNYKKVTPEFSNNYTVIIPAKKELEYFLKKQKVINAKNPNVRYELKNKNNEAESVMFNVKYLLDIEKYGIEKLSGQDNKKAFTGKFEGMNIVIMPMMNE